MIRFRKKRHYILLLIVIITLPVSLMAQQGSISGSVFYKYNELMGNRPDAGAIALLYGLTNPEKVYDGSVGIDGKFEISKVDAGRYLLVVLAKGVNANPFDTEQSLITWTDSIERAIQFIPKAHKPDIQAQIKEMKELRDKELYGKASKKKLGQYDLSLFKLGYAYISTIPMAYAIKLGLFSPMGKLNIQDVTIDSGEKKVVIDFGITFTSQKTL